MSDVTPQLDLAEFLAESYFPNDAVRPLEIAEINGITSCAGHYEDAFDGLLELSADRFHIYLNLDRLCDPNGRRTRFTTAHELGHFFIDEHRNALIAGVGSHPSFTEFVTNLIVERQADEFAATLLMPPKRFRSVAKQMDVGLKSIALIADLFETSIMSTAIRYARSDIASVAVMLWAESERRWCWSSRDVWEITQNKAHKRTSCVPEGSATRSLLESATNDTTAGRGSVLSQWFPFVSAGSAKDKICREEAIRLGNFGVLTLLEVC